ncbi:hypothetical protein [Actinotalea sp.]|uniref:hypothetical protein n=1 Tax=Actinotalea sp. TaxID=1872145 RepID=UPI002B91B228|nr:hypothetical protein [Actinotalea sp.]HRA49962.1 hypothetical protein [Actinotalea sp.]
MAVVLERAATARPRGGAARPGGAAAESSVFSIRPLAVLVLGFPVWWILGLSELLPLAIAAVMGLQLARSRDVRLPRGALWWGLFLLWALGSGLMLWVDAPGAVPGGGPSRILVWAYRLAWYLAITVVLLWLRAADERSVPTRRVVDLMGVMFVITVGGGLLGTFAPGFEVRSLVEMVLPGGLASNPFVQQLVHPQAASASTFLGHDAARPIAPFAYANSWGANFALFLPFFLASWLRRGAGWRRWAAPAVLIAGVVPVVYSLNRALWAALAVAAVYGFVRLALRGHLRSFLVSLIVLVLAGAAFLASPLAEDTLERLNNAHSNDRRADLLVLTVTSTAEGSPVMGFGSTRDVQGGFASIASGSTPDCSACGVPPLGTQGLLWTVIFAQGLVGTVFFLLFLLRRARAHWRSRSTIEAIAVVSLLSFTVTLPVYDTLGMPFFTVMVALALAWREGAGRGWETDHALRDVVDRGLDGWRPVVGLTLAGLVAGGAVAATQPTEYAARSSLLLTPVPVTIDPSTGAARKKDAITIDTEAALVVSAATLSAISDDADEQAALRRQIIVTATSNTAIVNLEYRDTDRQRAEEVVQAIANSYLEVRSGYLALRREQVLRSLEDQFAHVLAGATAAGGSADADLAVAETRIRTYIAQVSLTPTVAGETLRDAVSERVRKEVEVPVASVGALALLLGLVGAGLTTRRRPDHRASRRRLPPPPPTPTRPSETSTEEPA